MLKELLLSISIPTYNRCKRLEATIHHLVELIDVIESKDDLLEIVITSNGSTDDTDEIAENFAKKYSFIHFYKNEKNYGIDENIARAVENSRGRFVHLLSDDDFVIAETYPKILDALIEFQDLDFLFLNAAVMINDRYDKLTKPVAIINRPEEFQWLEKNIFFESVGVWLTFISSFVIRRNAWLNTKSHRKYVGTEIYLTHVAIEMAANKGGAYILNRINIAVRPHFSGSYRVFRAFSQEWRCLLFNHAKCIGFNHSSIKKIFLQSIKSDLPGRVLSTRYSRKLTFDELRLIIINTWDYPQAWLYLFPLLFLPLSIFMKISIIKNIMKKLKI